MREEPVLTSRAEPRESLLDAWVPLGVVGLWFIDRVARGSLMHPRSRR